MLWQNTKRLRNRRETSDSVRLSYERLLAQPRGSPLDQDEKAARDF
jgi:hypothetical protein